MSHNLAGPCINALATDKMNLAFCLFVLWVLLTFALAWEPDVCQEVHINSQTGNKSRLFVRDSRGNGANVRSVTLLDQISETPCVKWDNFGHTGFTIFVENGCEGKFSVCHVSGSRPPEVPITSYIECTNVRLVSQTRKADEQLMAQYVRGGDLIVSMHLLQQLSAVSCVRGLSFDFFDHKVEAKFGCKGDFRVCVDTLLILSAVVPDIKCEMFVLISQADMEDRLTVPLTYGGIVSITLVKEYSNNVCIKGKTFGFDKNHGLEIFANNGCEGQFDVCQSPQDLLPPKERWEII